MTLSSASQGYLYRALPICTVSSSPYRSHACQPGTTPVELLPSALHNLRNTLRRQTEYVGQAAETLPLRMPRPDLLIPLALRRRVVCERDHRQLLADVQYLFTLPSVTQSEPIDNGQKSHRATADDAIE